MALFGRGRATEQRPAPAQESKPNEAPSGAEKKEEGTTMADKTKKPAGPSKGAGKQHRKPSSEAVLSRARQMMRQEKRKLWAALGFDGEFDEGRFDEQVEALSKSKDESKGATEKAEGRLRQLEQENVDLRRKLTDQQAKATKAQQALAKAEDQLDRFKVEQEIREAARDSGLIDVDYGVELFKRHVKGLPEDKEAQPGDFFGELRKDTKRRHLFQAEDVVAGPRPAVEQQQTEGQKGAPQGRDAVDAPPKPAAGKQPSDELDAGKMNRADFAKHSRERYGYSPGMA